MVVHNCIQETNIALLSKATQDMADKINKIEDSVDTIRIDLQKVKDFMGTMQLSSERNNADIKQIIQEGFNEMNLKFKDEKEKAKSQVLEEVKQNYAGKYIEKSLIWIVITISGTIITAITLTIMKLVGKT